MKAAIAAMLGGLLLIASTFLEPSDADPDGPEPIPVLSPYGLELARTVEGISLPDRQSLYGKFAAFAEWVETTNQVNDTSQIDAVYQSAKVGVNVPAMGAVIEAEATKRGLKKPAPIADVRSDWVAFFEEMAAGCRWAEEYKLKREQSE